MSRPVVLLTARPLPIVLDGLEARFEVLRLWEAADKDALIDANAARIEGIAATGHAVINAAFIDRLPKLKIVANFGVGYDTVDAVHAGKRGVLVTNTPDVLTEEVADTALGLLLMTARELGAAERHLRDGKWAQGAYPLTRGTLQGAKRMGILGFGRIGLAIARRAEAFGISVAYHNRRKVADAAYPYYDSLVGLARDVDILVSVAPGGASTHHIVNAEVFEALGPEGIFVSIGRGSVVDEAALIAALNGGKILGAGLDVFETEPCWPKELMECPRTVLLPHVGSASVHTRNLMGQLVVDNLTSWFDKGQPVTPVAETPWPRG